MQRRAGVTGGTADGMGFVPFAVVGVLAPGGSATAKPVFFDRFNQTDEDYFFGSIQSTLSMQVTLYDPFYICCAFGPEEPDDNDGWADGDVVWGKWNHYEKKWQVVAPFGLIRKAYLREELEIGGNAPGDIVSHDRDGTDAGGISGVTIYHWGNTGDPIPDDTPVQVWFESRSRRWYTSAFFQEST